MATTLSPKRGYPMPSGNIGDKRLTDIAAIKSALTAIDNDISNCATIIVPQNTKASNYTCQLTDNGKHLLHPSSDTAARVWTIPSNAVIAFDIGTAITFVNQNAAGVISIEINSDVMRLAGEGTLGTRTLAANGCATALKITATEWIISGTGLS